MAKPSISPPDIDPNAIGVPGLRRSGSFVYDDFLPDLNGINGRRLYREMADNDPVIGSMLFSISMLVRSVDWRIEPADGTPQAEEVADWIESMLFERMDHSWAGFIDEVCSMFAYGFAFHEVLWRKGADGRWEVRGLPMRAQESVYQFEFAPDGDDLQAIVQQPWAHPAVTIPMNRVLLFRTTQAKNNPEGRSILRNAVTAYRRKKEIEASEASAARRASGIVVMSIPSAYLEPDASADQKAFAEQIRQYAADIAKDKEGAVVLPSDMTEDGERLFDLRYVSVDAQKSTDMGEIVERYDRRMAMTVLAQWIFLGQQKAGSFALSSDQTELFSNALGAWLKSIAGELNRRLIPMIGTVNGVSEELWPEIKHGDIEKPELDRLGGFLRDAAGSGLISPDDSIEDALRGFAGLPERKDEDDEPVRLGPAGSAADDDDGG